jgi:hypothetical protein
METDMDITWTLPLKLSLTQTRQTHYLNNVTDNMQQDKSVDSETSLKEAFFR